MNNKPTPETDKEAQSPYLIQYETVDANFARRLERERDEALEKIKQQKLEIVRLNGATNHAGGTPLKIALRERDEAREEVEFLKKTPLRQRCQELERLSDHWCDMHTVAAKERDEARDILRKLLEIIPEPECHDFGHTKEERHTFFEKCPVMERYDALIAQAEEAAK